MYENLEKHFAPNESIVSYDKLVNLCKHQIKLYQEAQQKVEQNATYYLFQEPEAIRDYWKLQTKIEEWEWLLEILKERWEILTL